MQGKIYTLPEINIVGGTTQEIQFNLIEEDGTAYSTTHCANMDFSICNYSLKTGTPLFSLQVDKVTDNSAVQNKLRVVIPAVKTKDLYGKYIYQLIIKDTYGNYEIPNQGILNITKNIHQDFVV